MTKVQQITITKEKAIKGSNRIAWNVDLDGKPFGQIWTFKNTFTETYRFSVSTLAGYWSDFGTYEMAERAIRGQM